MENVTLDVSLVVAAARYMQCMDERGEDFSHKMVGGAVTFDADREEIVFLDKDDVEIGSTSY